MRTKLMLNISVIAFCSVSIFCSSKIAIAVPPPTASQIMKILKIGKSTLSAYKRINEVYQAYNRYIKDGETTQYLRNKDGSTLSYTASCNSLRKVEEFRKHPNNETVMAVLKNAFPNDLDKQNREILDFIKGACP